MNDGAAALVVSSREYAEQQQHQPIARVVGYAKQPSNQINILRACQSHSLALQRADGK